MPILDTRPKDARRRMTPARSDDDEDEAGSEAGPSVRSPKKRRVDTQQYNQPPPSVHAWLHPDAPPPLMTESPPLHSSSSTFLAFSLAFMPPIHITSESTLAKEARRMVRELDVPTLVGHKLLDCGEGAFQDGNGKVGSKKGKERIREPDHRMWAVRTLCLKERRDGTGGEDDYQLLETFNDDGEKFGGERILRALRDGQGVDVLTVCCRWYGGEMIGPIRFQHIGLTTNTSLTSLVKLVALRDLRQTLESLDHEIDELRQTLNPPGSPLQSVDNGPGAGGPAPPTAERGKYDGIVDKARLERLILARQKTKSSLEGRAVWIARDQAKAEDQAASAAGAGGDDAPTDPA